MPAVEAAAADGGVAEVDHRVPAGVQAGEGGADGDGLAGADLAGDDAQAAFADAPVDAGDGFGVGAVAVQHLRRQRLAERGVGESVVATSASRSCRHLAVVVVVVVSGVAAGAGQCAVGRARARRAGRE